MRITWTPELITTWLESHTPTIHPVDPTKCLHTKSRVEWVCNVCDNHWETTFNKIKEWNTRCPRCSKRNAPHKVGHLIPHVMGRKLTLQEIRARLEGRGIEPATVDEVGGVQDMREWRCVVCAHQWKAKILGVIHHKSQCPNCLKAVPIHNKLGLPKLLERLALRLEVTYVGGYSHTMAKCQWACRVCGGGWLAIPNNVLRGQGCPECSKHKREKRLGELLANSGLEIEAQHRLACPKQVRARGWVRVDYYIPSLNCIIEHHGVQHFQHTPFFHRRKGVFEAQQTRDEWLRAHCDLEGIRYVEVSYLEKDPEGYIRKVLPEIH